MSVSAPFIRRPVATTLLTVAVAISGVIAFRMLPVSPLPQVDFPTISVNAGLPGASPEIMATSVATPLEKQFTRIAGVTEMTSSSGLGSCSVTLQFDLGRDINAAARDVQAAINAAHGYLPANLPSNPTYRKINPADAPVMIISLTSDVNTRAQMYDIASSIFAQKLSQINGVGQVNVGGSSLPAVRVELNPQPVNNYGLSLDSIATFLSNANANRPKGELAGRTLASPLYASDQLLEAKDYQNLVVTYRSGAPIRLSDLGRVVDSVEDLRNMGSANGKPSILIIINRQPNANIIDTVDRIRAVLPQFEAALPATIHLRVDNDRTNTIRASVHDVEGTMLISIGLVILVVFAFLRNGWATFIPSVSVPVSLIGTFSIMYLLGYSIDNLSLMALTICTGFVVDDAIVVIENITRLLENGEAPMQAALQGAAEIGFTVVSMSTSLIAVFIPILMMGGIVGRLFREFAMTLSIAIMVSMCVSLTTTPMMCARLLKVTHNHGRLYRLTERFFDWILTTYAAALRVVLNHPALTMIVMLATIGLNVYLYVVVPKGFFPEQDTGRMMGNVLGDQSLSFQAMVPKLKFFLGQVMSDPAVDTVDAFTGGGRGGATNTANMFLQLKPLDERDNVSADEVISRIRRKTGGVPGATLFLQAAQDIRVGGRMSNALYQFTITSGDLQLLNQWAPKVLDKLRTLPELADVSSDQQNAGLSANVVVDRDTSARLGLTVAAVDTALYSAFGQRQVSTMYKSINQYHVVMEVAPEYWQDPTTLDKIYVTTTTGAKVPLSAFTRFAPGHTPLSIPHQGQFPAVTISFNLRDKVALGQAVDAITSAEQEMGMPATIVGKFAGTAQAYQDSLRNEPVLIATALIAVYIVLGILYESLIHPLTILSTLPSAGVGALIALIICHTQLTVIALIGIILLIGLVKKNAILMIDFALAAERNEGKNSRDAIYEACILRFRPIMMTTMAALFGGLPLALGHGTGYELRQPLGIAIVGGLIVSQMLTLFTTPVVYLFMDRLRGHAAKVRPGRRRPGILIPGGAAESAD